MLIFAIQLLLMNIVLIGIIAITALTSYKGFNDAAFFRKLEFHIGSIRQGEQYRMFTSALLHADIMHLFLNMFGLYVFAPVVANWMGDMKMLLIYLCSLACGSLLMLLLHRHDYHYRAIGASGAVTGILYSAILLQPKMELYLFFIPIGIPAYIVGIGYLLYSIYGMRARRDNIGHTAHFGGAIGGYLMTLAYFPSLFSDNLFMVILLGVPIVLFVILERLGKL